MGDIIHIYRLRELRALPKPSWLIEGILHRNTIAVIAASKAAFKTFLAIDFGMNVALGRDWNGHKTVQGNVLHIVGEGGSGISARTQAWEIHNGIALPEPSAWSCTMPGINLMDENKASALCAAALQAFPNGIELLVVDTLARNQHGDENSTQQMSALVQNIDSVRDVLGCTVLFLHHFNRGGKFRGSSVLDGAFDTVILMDREGDISTVVCDKQKDAAEFEPFRLKKKWIDVPDTTDGSIVLELDTSASPHISIILRELSRFGSKGATIDQVKDICPLEAKSFDLAWHEAIRTDLIVPKDGMLALRNTVYVRNLQALDIAA